MGGCILQQVISSPQNKHLVQGDVRYDWLLSSAHHRKTMLSPTLGTNSSIHSWNGIIFLQKKECCGANLSGYRGMY